MAKKLTTAQICNFIKMIAPDVQKAYATLGKVKPSVCIGMACVESGCGSSNLMFSHNALWGQKVGTGKTAIKYWSGTFFTARTKEEYTIGKHTVITDAFRSYKSIYQGACNYYELLNTKLYARVKSEASAEEQMAQIKACGYMTSSTEVQSVLTYINKYNLKQYDNVGGVTPAKYNPYKSPLKLMKVGVHNEGVKWLQYELNNFHGYLLAVDGWYGTKTKEAVKDFQKKHNLVVDGICGKKYPGSVGG